MLAHAAAAFGKTVTHFAGEMLGPGETLRGIRDPASCQREGGRRTKAGEPDKRGEEGGGGAARTMHMSSMNTRIDDAVGNKKYQRTKYEAWALQNGILYQVPTSFFPHTVGAAPKGLNRCYY